MACLLDSVGTLVEERRHHMRLLPANSNSILAIIIGSHSGPG